VQVREFCRRGYHGWTLNDHRANEVVSLALEPLAPLALDPL
jgi:hypothetical protein